MLFNHLAAFTVGFILDLIIGDPHCIPHPVCAIGSLIDFLEKKLYPAEGGQKTKNAEDSENAGNTENADAGNENTGNENTGNGYKAEGYAKISCSRDRKLFIRGLLLAAIVIAVSGAASYCILYAAYHNSIFLGIIIEALMTGQIFAAKSLRVESMKVCSNIEKGKLSEARTALSMIVGRDTAVLDEAGIERAAVETIAENTSDGVIAPMIAVAIGGPALGFMYKAVNTMDSMIGYKNDRYIFFGRAAAKLDDALNMPLSRISAYLMIAAAFILSLWEKISCRGQKLFSGKRAFRIYIRDRRKHESPNSAQTESVCAGALGLRLAGDAVYGGHIIHKPYIGDDIRPIEAADIRKADSLMTLSAVLCFILCAAGIIVAAVCKC